MPFTHCTLLIQRQSCHHIETSQLICRADLRCKSIDWFLYDGIFRCLMSLVPLSRAQILFLAVVFCWVSFLHSLSFLSRFEIKKKRTSPKRIVCHITNTFRNSCSHVFGWKDALKNFTKSTTNVNDGVLF